MARNKNYHNPKVICNCETCTEFYDNFIDCEQCEGTGHDCIRCDGIGYLYRDD